jgi:hypothetical protein
MEHSGAIEHSAARGQAVPATFRLQFTCAADDVIDFFAAMAVKWRVMSGIDLDDAQAQTQSVESSFRINELEVADRPALLLHRRPIEPLPGLDDDPGFVAARIRDHDLGRPALTNAPCRGAGPKLP